MFKRFFLEEMFGVPSKTISKRSLDEKRNLLARHCQGMLFQSSVGTAGRSGGPSATVAIAAAIFMITLGLVAGGRVKSVMMPSTEADNAYARITMPLGTPAHETEDAVARVNAALDELRRELEARGRPGDPQIGRAHV